MDIENTSICGDHSCIFGRVKGIGTNGGCRCFSGLDSSIRTKVRLRVSKTLAYVKELEKELTQFREVAGLDPINYPNGRRLPDAELMQDPAFLAFKLDKLETWGSNPPQFSTGANNPNTGEENE